jgi:hypothetical protein
MLSHHRALPNLNIKRSVIFPNRSFSFSPYNTLIDSLCGPKQYGTEYFDGFDKTTRKVKKNKC